jgi:hypothetical protein
MVSKMFSFLYKIKGLLVLTYKNLGSSIRGDTFLKGVTSGGSSLLWQVKYLAFA